MSDHPGIAPSGEPVDFEGCLARVNPTKSSLRQLAEQPDQTPIIMLNLLRFRPRGDSGIYALYAREAAPEVEKVDSFVGYFGAVITDLDPALGFDSSYDAMVMPVYHRRDSYLTLQRSSIYQLAIPYRSAGTSRRTLYVLRDADKPVAGTHSIAGMNASREPLPVAAGEIAIIDAVRCAGPQGRQDFQSWIDGSGPLLSAVGATRLLCLQAEVPVLSEEYWDQCSVMHFPSLEAVTCLYQSEAWLKLKATRDQALENSVTVATAGLPIPG